jgi:tetratricopeptide (TPR) repeat protein
VAALLAAAESAWGRRRFDEAERMCASILSREPQHVGALHLAGLVAMGGGNPRAAQQRLERAAALRPDPAILVDLAVALITNGGLEEAVRCCRKALAADPRNGAAHYNLGTALNRMHDFQEAIAPLREAVRLAPDFLPARANLGQALRGAGETGAARDELERVLERDPAHVNALLNLANVCHESGDFAKSDALFARVLERMPGNAQARYDYGLALLARREYRRGWEFHEARWDAYRLPDRAAYAQPAWHGEPLSGKRLLVWGEQGLGDQIMFASIVPELLTEAASVCVVCEPRLVGLFARSFPAARVVAAGGAEHAAARQDGFDYQVPIASLALHRRRNLAEFPRHDGYLRADPDRVKAWTGRLAALGGGLKVGISWRGGAPGTRERMRSIPLETWRPLLRDPQVVFVSLQYTNCAAELAEFRARHGGAPYHWQEAIDDYEDTAALVSALDLVVTVCTSLVHLAGALAKPARVLVPALPGWRYASEDGRMPWYPSARLLRQARTGDWRDVMQRAAADLGAASRG